MSFFVLVVDDDREVRWLLSEFCEPYGATVLEARDGEEGERIFRENPSVCLVLTDERMPKMTGREMLHRILSELRRRGGQAALLTGQMDAEMQLDCHGMQVPCIDKLSMCEPLQQLLALQKARSETLA